MTNIMYIITGKQGFEGELFQKGIRTDKKAMLIIPRNTNSLKEKLLIFLVKLIAKDKGVL